MYFVHSDLSILILNCTHIQQTIGQLIDTTVDDIFDDHPQTSFQAPPQPDPRDELIEAMTAEIKRLKQEIELMQFEVGEETTFKLFVSILN